MKLLGSFKIDDDAVLSRKTKLIARGILRTSLSSRVPAKSGIGGEKVVPTRARLGIGDAANFNNIFILI